ncbi:NAD(P)/FAD-dependent oxidoreductase [Maribacter sp. 2307ULW6-5]|uniref:NAD(P)/FAD-dependent oxidoreductase n=1 Tax=Maribacter sp. 2307ULW6-5 TaxID=3386275 RepID=UPI0039BCB911
MKKEDIIIIGGGLSGLTAAIHLARAGCSVTLFEPQAYPRHRVCGEYVSNEVLPYLEHLGISVWDNGALPIQKMAISDASGTLAQAKLPLGGFGLSRFGFDQLLYHKALEMGVRFIFRKIGTVHFLSDHFVLSDVQGTEYRARLVIGAYGKRSQLDKWLKRPFAFRKQSWLAVKAHYALDDFPDDLVALHNFEGGYGGLSKTELGTVNFCYLVHYDSFKRYKGVDDFNERVVAQNPHLEHFLERASPTFKTPLTIAQIAFDRKHPVEGHMLMCGDSAGLIHPLCGNGMAMAIHSAKLASEAVVRHLGKGEGHRLAMETDYASAWNRTFRRRLWYGRKIQGILLNQKLLNVGLSAARHSQGLMRYAIKKTHGKPVMP